VRCWLARFSSRPCGGPLERAHLIRQQVIIRELRLAKPKLAGSAEQQRSFRIVWDERAWVWACARHHHALDKSRRLRIARSDLPPGVEAFAARYGLRWYLAREYGSQTLWTQLPARCGVS